MAKLLVPDESWAIVEPLLLRQEPSPQGGHPRVPDCVCLTGMLFVPGTGIPWEGFPHEMGCAMTRRDRPHEWTRAGVRPALHRTLLARLRGRQA